MGRGLKTMQPYFKGRAAALPYQILVGRCCCAALTFRRVLIAELFYLLRPAHFRQYYREL
jgi:hypothetical protein